MILGTPNNIQRNYSYPQSGSKKIKKTWDVPDGSETREFLLIANICVKLQSTLAITELYISDSLICTSQGSLSSRSYLTINGFYYFIFHWTNITPHHAQPNTIFFPSSAAIPADLIRKMCLCKKPCYRGYKNANNCKIQSERTAGR